MPLKPASSTLPQLLHHLIENAKNTFQVLRLHILGTGHWAYWECVLPVILPVCILHARAN